MLETKERIITLLDMMSEKQSENLLKYIKEKYRLSPKAPDWEDIEAVEPDALDLKMLKAAETDPDSKEFISYEDTIKALGL